MQDARKRPRGARSKKRGQPETTSGDSLRDPSWDPVLRWLAEDPAVLAYLNVPDPAPRFEIEQGSVDIDKAMDRLRRSIA